MSEFKDLYKIRGVIEDSKLKDDICKLVEEIAKTPKPFDRRMLASRLLPLIPLGDKIKGIDWTSHFTYNMREYVVVSGLPYNMTVIKHGKCEKIEYTIY